MTRRQQEEEKEMYVLRARCARDDDDDDVTFEVTGTVGGIVRWMLDREMSALFLRGSRGTILLGDADGCDRGPLFHALFDAIRVDDDTSIDDVHTAYQRLDEDAKRALAREYDRCTGAERLVVDMIAWCQTNPGRVFDLCGNKGLVGTIVSNADVRSE